LHAPYQSAPIPLLPIWDAIITSENLLAISGPALFSGYLSEGKFHPRQSSWHTTSDRVILENQSLTPLGRADALVKVLGELVDPEAIEHQLLALSEGHFIPGTFAVVALPDERAGNILVPVFEATACMSVIGRVISLYHAQKPGFRTLSPPVLIGKFPRSEMGKLQRSELVTMCQRQLSESGLPPA